MKHVKPRRMIVLAVELDADKIETLAAAGLVEPDERNPAVLARAVEEFLRIWQLRIFKPEDTQT